MQEEPTVDIYVDDEDEDLAGFCLVCHT